VLSDPEELARRLARRRSASFLRWPRDWCVAIGACDRRIDRPTVRQEPQRAAPARKRHLVRITRQLLLEVNRPIEIPRPGLDQTELARLLGCGLARMRVARATGRLSTHYIRGFAEKSTNPAAIVYTPLPLAPSRKGQADWVWGNAWARALGHEESLPSDFQQALERVPVWYPTVSTRPEPVKATPYHVPPVPPDYVWYKWKGDQYMGYDWRNERSRIGYERAQARKKRIKAYRARQRSEGRLPPSARPKGAGGSLLFHGWMWLCPGCARLVRKLYLPVHAVNALNLLGDADPKIPQVEAYEPPPATLACRQCHRLRFTNRAEPAAWTRLIMHLSAGLLYGHEVPQPAWFFKPSRKYRPHTTRAAPRRDHVRRRLLEGWTLRQIAREMEVRPLAVYKHMRELCRQERVASRDELVKKLRRKEALPSNRPSHVTEMEGMREPCREAAVRLPARR
jgi:hypothetical protein